MDAVTEANRRAWEMASNKHVREYDDLLAQAAAGSSLNAVERGRMPWPATAGHFALSTPDSLCSNSSASLITTATEVVP